jgi:hypothetical protein
MQLRAWRPLRRNTLYGFASISIPALGLDFDDVTPSAGIATVGEFAGRPMIDADGGALRDERGKIRYASPIRWATNGLASRFGERVIALLLKHHPNAFSDEPAP